MKGVLGGTSRPTRVLIHQKAVMKTTDGTDLEVVLTDISAEGFRLKARETFYIGENILIGEQVTICIDRRDDLQAQVVWALGCEAGGTFIAAAAEPL